MEIRKTRAMDLEAVLQIYACARKFMKETGNPDQWKDSHPTLEMIENDIREGTGYVVIDEGRIVGCFAFILGEDPTYGYIEGKWLNDEPYGTIHRIASIGHGVFEQAVSYCQNQIENIRIDTHHDNKVMQHKILKNGFSYCGIIYIADGSPRLAYQLKK